MKLLLLLTCYITMVQPVPWSLPQGKGELDLHHLKYIFAQGSFLLLHKDLAETVHDTYIKFAQKGREVLSLSAKPVCFSADLCLQLLSAW